MNSYNIVQLTLLMCIIATVHCSQTRSTSCSDKRSRCKTWASQGECEKNPKYMLVKCKKSCKVCGETEDRDGSDGGDSGGSEALSFPVIGDWGTGGSSQKRVANAMGKWASDHRASFVISVGDNFYESGVTSATDRKFTDYWKDVYTHPALKGKTWYAVAGNHDHYYNRAGNQVSRSKSDSRWYFPSLSYSFYKNSGSQRIHFIGFDTEKGRSDDNQIAWLEKTLKGSSGDWIIVFGHHPCASSGNHGRSRSCYYNMRPLFNRYKVAFYFSGHDHDMEYLTKSGEDVAYIVSGSGGKTRSFDTDSNADLKRKGFTSKFFKADYGFVGVKIEGSSAKVSYIDDSGRQVYSFQKRNPKA